MDNFINQVEKEFELKFVRTHSQLTHIGDKENRENCELCKLEKENNPKGYYKTFFNEQKCYWNDELYQDVLKFISQKLQEAQLKAREELKKEIVEMIEEVSKKLPIEIERTNSDYRQGMHSGIDLIIDKIKNI